MLNLTGETNINININNNQEGEVLIKRNYFADKKKQEETKKKEDDDDIPTPTINRNYFARKTEIKPRRGATVPVKINSLDDLL